MLSKLRSGTITQFFMGAVVLIIAAAFLLDSRTTPQGSTLCAAEVHGHCVPPRDFNKALRLAVPPNLEPKQIREMRLNETLLEGLVERELLVREAERIGVGVSNEAVDRELGAGRFRYSLPAARYAQAPMLARVNVNHPQTKRFNFQIYTRTVRNYARMTPKDFKQDQTRELIAARMRDLIRSTARVSEVQARALFVASEERSTVRVAQVDKSWLSRFVISLSETELAEYGAAHDEELKVVWEANKTDFAEGCRPTWEVRMAYPPGADEADRTAVAAQARKLAARASGQADFSALAKIYSTGASAGIGGWVGCLATENEPVSALAQAVQGLANDGVSDPWEEAGGMRFVKVEAALPSEALDARGKQALALRRATEEKAAASAEALARRILAATGQGEPLGEATQRLAEEAIGQSTGIDSVPGVSRRELETAAMEARFRPRVEVSAPFTRTDAVRPIANAAPGQAPKILAFELEAADQVYPQPVETRDGWAVLQLKERVEASDQSFEKEKAAVLAEARGAAGALALTRYVAQLKAASQSEIELNPQFFTDASKSADDS